MGVGNAKQIYVGKATASSTTQLTFSNIGFTPNNFIAALFTDNTFSGDNSVYFQSAIIIVDIAYYSDGTKYCGIYAPYSSKVVAYKNSYAKNYVTISINNDTISLTSTSSSYGFGWYSNMTNYSYDYHIIAWNE